MNYFDHDSATSCIPLQVYLVGKGKKGKLLQHSSHSWDTIQSRIEKKITSPMFWVLMKTTLLAPLSKAWNRRSCFCVDALIWFTSFFRAASASSSSSSSLLDSSTNYVKTNVKSEYLKKVNQDTMLPLRHNTLIHKPPSSVLHYKKKCCPMQIIYYLFTTRPTMNTSVLHLISFCCFH